jgi:hypothetical protein
MALLHEMLSSVAGPAEARESQYAQSKSCTEVEQVARAVKRMLAYDVGDIVGLHRTQDVAVGHLDRVEADRVDVLHALDSADAALLLLELRAVGHPC